MLRFRRKIRKGLITDNKFGKYILYAIGEIFLVVVGILIAVGVNNSNSRKIEEARVDRFVDRLKVQLEDNLFAVNDYIETNELFYSESKRLTAIIGDTKVVNNEAKIDSLILFNSYDYHLNLDMNILIESRENGDLALISNDSLSQAIYYLITYYKEIVENERITNSNLNNHFVPYLYKNYNLKKLINSVAEDDDLKESRIYSGDNYKILTEQEFENHITLRLILSKQILDAYIELKEIILDINELL